MWQRFLSVKVRASALSEQKFWVFPYKIWFFDHRPDLFSRHIFSLYHLFVKVDQRAGGKNKKDSKDDSDTNILNENICDKCQYDHKPPISSNDNL